MLIVKWDRIPRRRGLNGGKYVKYFYLATLECGHQQITNSHLPAGPERVDKCHTCGRKK